MHMGFVCLFFSKGKDHHALGVCSLENIFIVILLFTCPHQEKLEKLARKKVSETMFLKFC